VFEPTAHRRRRMTPLVSILIPAYNAERWIDETLQSALNQTWSRKEIIVVDDGSRDQTVAVARRYAAGNVSIIRQENQGASAARNKAFSVCQGDYVQWLDADDLLGADKIERQMAIAAEASNRRLLLSSPWGHFFYRPHKARFIKTPLWDDLLPVEWMLRKLGQNLHMQTATWLVSRELTVEAGPWNTQLVSDDDGEYFCRVLLASDGVRFDSGGKVYYRIAGSGSWGTLDRSRRKLEAQWVAMRMHIQYLRGVEDSDRVRAACLRYLQNWFLHFYPEHGDLVMEFDALARQLGGNLARPQLPWKYAWIERVWGTTPAKWAWIRLPQAKSTVFRSWDRLLAQRSSRLPR
jgi:glycosyltransferase involved in cell wall biosynthesis